MSAISTTTGIRCTKSSAERKSTSFQQRSIRSTHLERRGSTPEVYCNDGSIAEIIRVLFGQQDERQSGRYMSKSLQE